MTPPCFRSSKSGSRYGRQDGQGCKRADLEHLGETGLDLDGRSSGLAVTGWDHRRTEKVAVLPPPSRWTDREGAITGCWAEVPVGAVDAC